MPASVLRTDSDIKNW